MPARLPLDQLVNQIDLLIKELAMTGRWLLVGLEGPMQTLKSGRSPRAIALAEHLGEPEGMLVLLDEILQDLQGLFPELRRYYMEWHGKNPNSPDVQQLEKQLPDIEKEWGFWKSFADRSRALLKKLRLISEEEKLSPLARAPLQDAWEEVAVLARGR